LTLTAKLCSSTAQSDALHFVRVNDAHRHYYREEEAAREAARLGEELRKLQREWRDASAALDAERRRANDAVAARDGDRAATADK
jgi:urease accessory protein UreF